MCIKAFEINKHPELIGITASLLHRVKVLCQKIRLKTRPLSIFEETLRPSIHQSETTL